MSCVVIRQRDGSKYCRRCKMLWDPDEVVNCSPKLMGQRTITRLQQDLKKSLEQDQVKNDRTTF